MSSMASRTVGRRMLDRRALSWGACLALALSGAGAAQAQSVRVAEDGVVSLSATATREVPRDLLTITLAVTRDGTDSANVQTQLKQVLDAALVEARKSAQPGALDVSTGGFGLYPRYTNTGRINGWQGSAELVLAGKDTQRVAQVAGRLQGMNITGVNFSLSRELREQQESELTAQAIQKFRAHAQDIAKGFGYSGYVVREVNVQAGGESGVMPMPRVAMMAKAEMSADAPVPVEAGKGSFSVTVSGRIVMKAN